MSAITLERYQKELVDLFRSNGDASNRKPMENYMRNHFSFLGIKSPKRKMILKEFFRDYGKPELEWISPLVAFLYEQPEREFHYSALAMIDVHIKKSGVEWLPLLEELIVKKSWWDTVDHIAPHHVGAVLLREKTGIIDYPDRWIESDNFWLQRSALLFQLKYKEKTDEEKLFSYIEATKGSKEFFIQKAIGWALREYSKTAPEEVLRFINSTEDLAPLSRREGLKHLERKKLNSYS
ncbi:DNA alkylation repair protein [Sutcliffiella horikoshii]|uniref:DNA alkylation repair protein n=1 Tax=Sutcliffiella horikoshii TaxID=79883 RepID=UPI001F412B5D|nr:DNA alkylation repair protein [Sutcliffiella horikoshii]MCG1021800.1 DNA alkylation repair protein [Sutcliffiella horikoshii]